jgi:hypothetical protein
LAVVQTDGRWGIRVNKEVQLRGLSLCCDWGSDIDVRFPLQSRIHNHRINKAIYTALKRSADLIDGELLDQLDAFVAANTDTKQITEYLSDKSGTFYLRAQCQCVFLTTCFAAGLPLATQQIRNLINARLGDGLAEDRLKQLLARFIDEDGCTCLLVQDEWDLTCGIVLQNPAQKEVFRRWGETLVLDWTHNTNNLGFYLGKLRNFLMFGSTV